MFEIIDKENDKQDSKQGTNCEIDKLLLSAASYATSIAIHPDINGISPADLLNKYSPAKLSSLQLTTSLHKLKKKYDDTKKELFNIPATPENYQTLIASQSLAKEKLDKIRGKIKNISNDTKENETKLDSLRTEYTLSIIQPSSKTPEDIEFEIHSCVNGTKVQKIKIDSLKQGAEITDTEISLIKEATNSLIQRRIHQEYPPIKEEFYKALDTFIEIYNRACTAAIASNDYDIYQQNPQTTRHFRAESEIHDKTIHSISAVKSALDGEYVFAFRGKIINELSGNTHED